MPREESLRPCPATTAGFDVRSSSTMTSRVKLESANKDAFTQVKQNTRIYAVCSTASAFFSSVKCLQLLIG